MFTHVLVPLDRSPESEHALESAVTLALAADARLELLLVRELPMATELPYPIPIVDRSEDELYLKALARRASLAGLTNTICTLLDGDPAAKICAQARQNGASLIVMTSHFRTGIARAWAGSVADRVVRESGTPVLMIRPAHRPPSAILLPAGFKRILVPLDGSAAGAAVLPAVRAMAICNRADVFLLRILQPSTVAMSNIATPSTVAQMGLAMSQADFDAAEHAMQQLLNEATDELDSAAAQLRAEGVANVSWYVEKDNKLAHGILGFAAAHHIDVIAMSTHGRGASRLVVGSVADGVLSESGLPVLLQCPSQKLSDQPHLAKASMECQLPGLVA